MALDQLHGFLRRGDDKLYAPEVPPDVPLEDTAEIPAVIPDRVAPVRGTQMTYARQVAGAFRYAWQTGRRRARDEREREESWLHQRMIEQHSCQEVSDYAQSRAWVPPGHDGGLAEKLGDLYFVYGRARAAYLALQFYKCKRPARQSAWLVVKFAVAMAFLALLGHGALAAEITGGVVLAAGLLAAALMPRRSAIGDDPGEEDPEEEDDLP